MAGRSGRVCICCVCVCVCRLSQLYGLHRLLCGWQMAHKTHRDPMANWFLFSAFGTALKVAIIVSGGNETVERCSSSVFWGEGGGLKI